MPLVQESKKKKKKESHNINEFISLFGRIINQDIIFFIFLLSLINQQIQIASNFYQIKQNFIMK